jgi:translation elongation factor EF-1alpha
MVKNYLKFSQSSGMLRVPKFRLQVVEIVRPGIVLKKSPPVFHIHPIPLYFRIKKTEQKTENKKRKKKQTKRKYKA